MSGRGHGPSPRGEKEEEVVLRIWRRWAWLERWWPNSEREKLELVVGSLNSAVQLRFDLMGKKTC